MTVRTTMTSRMMDKTASGRVEKLPWSSRARKKSAVRQMPREMDVLVSVVRDDVESNPRGAHPGCRVRR